MSEHETAGEGRFNSTEIRILGSLIEKQATSPESYPLTLNALVLACNQKTSREPVMNLTQGQVGQALRALEGQGMTRLQMGSRADRWEQRVDKALELVPAQLVHQQSLAEIVLMEDEHPPRRAFSYFTYWMIVHGVACWLAGRRIPILAIDLRCAEPPFCDDYRVMFSENLRFERPRTRMIFSADCLDLPIKRSPEELKRFLAQAPANILVKYRDPQSLASRIKQDLRHLPAQQ